MLEAHIAHNAASMTQSNHKMP